MLYKAIPIALLAGVKLFFTAPVALAAGFTKFESFIILATGGCLGILVFYFFGGMITHLIASQILAYWGKKSKRFSKTSRLTVKIKRRSGIYGIAFLTPCILSIPIGSIVAYNYYRKNAMTLPLLLSSTILWSFLAVIIWGFIPF